MMDFRGWQYCTIVCATYFYMGMSACDGNDHVEQPPNIVFILSDDHRWDQLGCAGHPIVKTPNIDRLASDGIRFENMFVTTSICAASRASIFTGMYERGHRFTFGTKPLARQFVRSSYPEQLRRAGYQTGFVGKFGIKIEGDPKSMFDFFRPLGRSPYFKKQADGTVRHVTQLTGDHAVSFLDSHEGCEKPFCLSISFNAPHAEDGDKTNHFPVPKVVAGMYDKIEVPSARLSDRSVFSAHPPFFKTGMHRERFGWRWDTKEKYEKNMRGYWGMISGVDHVIGRVREKIQAMGQSGNTIIIFTGDNGYYLGQRGFAGKWSHYEESLRVPLVVLDPRVKSAGPRRQVLNQMVLNVDLAPTMLAMAGIEIPESYQGKSLTGMLNDELVDEWRTDFLCEHLFHLPGRIPKYEGVRGEQWTYARYFEQEPEYEFLHNLVDDPDQLTNCSTNLKYSRKLEEMRKRCDSLVSQFGEPYLLEGVQEEIQPKEQSERSKKVGRNVDSTKSDDGKSQPNVVLIISDDQHWSDYSFMNHPAVQTPSLDQLARQSTVFVNGYVPTAICRPSLASIITGRYPRNHGITGNDPARIKGQSQDEYAMLRKRLVGRIDQIGTLPKWLASAEYLSFQSGKWWEGHYSRGGFTDGMTHGDPSRGGRHGDVGLTIGREGLQPIAEFMDRAVVQDRPFFLWYAPFLPHTPHNPPERLLSKYSGGDRPQSLAKYYAMCEWFDETCGQLLQMIDDKGQRGNTMVIFVTDNGWIQRTSKTQAPSEWTARFAPRSKQSPNEGGVRTPLLIRWPNQKFSGRKTDFVSSLDIAPTILNACGVPVPGELPGVDLAKVATGEVALDHRPVFGEGYAHDVASIDRPQDSLIYRWVIKDGFKLIRRYDGKLGRHKNVHTLFGSSDQLFNLRVDPDEENNLATSQLGKVEELGIQLEQHWALGN